MMRADVSNTWSWSFSGATGSLSGLLNGMLVSNNPLLSTDIFCTMDVEAIPRCDNSIEHREAPTRVFRAMPARASL